MPLFTASTTMSLSSDASSGDDDDFTLSSFSFSSEGDVSLDSDACANAAPYAPREDPRCFYLDDFFQEWNKMHVAVLTDFTLAAHNGAEPVSIFHSCVAGMPVEDGLYTAIVKSTLLTVTDSNECAKILTFRSGHPMSQQFHCCSVSC
jgi:hypothetical protein